MERPVIVVAARYCADSGSDEQEGMQVRRAVGSAVVAAGGLPIMVAVEDPELLAESLDLADGVVMPGGGDSNPAMYGQEPVPELNQVSAAQDSGDTAVLTAALERELPVLGVCRGMQSLNIALGGDLVQHLEETTVGHRDTTHRITVTEDDSVVERVMGARTWDGKSIHHQVVGRPGDGLRVTARSDDGNIEAIEHDTCPWVGVQWHPELKCDTDDVQVGPFRWLVEEAAIRRARRA